MRFLAARDWQKIIPMPHRLHENEGAVEQKRNNASEDKLRRAELRTGRRCRDIRHDQCEDGQRRQDGECGARPMQMKALLAMPRATPQQADPDNAVAYDHDSREHSVACKLLFPVGAPIMTDTISATSMIVTAIANTKVPNGSPVRCATT